MRQQERGRVVVLARPLQQGEQDALCEDLRVEGPDKVSGLCSSATSVCLSLQAIRQAVHLLTAAAAPGMQCVDVPKKLQVWCQLQSSICFED
jgi:hypothetical protein